MTARSLPITSGLAVMCGCLSVTAHAEQPAPTGNVGVEQRLDDLAAKIASQQARLKAQDEQLAAQRIEINLLKLQVSPETLNLRGAGQPAAYPPNSSVTPQVQPTVGESLSPKPDLTESTQAVPQGQGVLTPPGKTTIQASVSYVRAANDRLVFAGIELVPGLQIGSIQASTADRNTTIGALTAWHGITGRLEAEIMVPLLSRTDSIGLAQVRDGTVSEGFRLHKTALGDVEAALRWQLNAPLKSDEPIFVASLRVKSDTGISPFSIAYDDFGIAKGLATGSGFWGIQPGMTFLMPSDPAVIYGGISYLYQIPSNINRMVDATLIGKVKPGGAISANLGFGFALNPRFSFSLGYSHTYIRPTSTELDGSVQKSSPLQIGTLDMGMAYRLTPRKSVNFAFQFGVTQDAPNVGMTLRLPLTF